MKNNKDENILICTGVKFYCKKMRSFFEWIKKINCIDKIFASGRMLYLHITLHEIPDQDLDDIIGLFIVTKDQI